MNEDEFMEALASSPFDADEVRDAMRLIGIIAVPLDALEEALLNLPDTPTLQRALAHYTALQVWFPDMSDEHSLRFVQIAYTAITDLREARDRLLNEGTQALEDLANDG